MNPEQPTTHRDGLDDVEGHGIKYKFADAERDEADDTEGHAVGTGARAPVAGTGSRQLLRPTHPRAEDDDVAGHLSGALGAKKKTEDGD